MMKLGNWFLRELNVEGKNKKKNRKKEKKKKKGEDAKKKCSLNSWPLIIPSPQIFNLFLWQNYQLYIPIICKIALFY